MRSRLQAIMHGKAARKKGVPGACRRFYPLKTSSEKRQNKDEAAIKNVSGGHCDGIQQGLRKPENDVRTFAFWSTGKPKHSVTGRAGLKVRY